MKKAAVWAVTGASGLLGQGMLRALCAAKNPVTAFRHGHPLLFRGAGVEEVVCDLADHRDFTRALDAAAPDILLHTAGLTSVDGCEADPDRARLLNTDIPVRLARTCREKGIRYIFISTDHLTDGTQALFTESAVLHPLNVYARTKADAEKGVAAENGDALIVRTNFFGKGLPWRKSLSDWLWDALVAGKTVPAFTDSFFTPIAVPLLCDAILSLTACGAKGGIYHLCGRERLSKYDFALAFADAFGFDPHLIRPSRIVDAGLSAPRPADMSMAVALAEHVLGRPLPDIATSLNAIRADYTS